MGSTGEALKQIDKSLADLSSSVATVSNAGQEQLMGIKSMTSSITTIDNGTQHNAQTASRAADTASTLRQGARTLLDQIAVFQVGDIDPAARDPQRKAG